MWLAQLRSINARVEKALLTPSIEASVPRNPVPWFEIYVQDVPRARRFYEAVLQVRLEKMESPETEDTTEMEMWAFPMEADGPGAAGALVRMDGFPSGGNSTLVYFSCDDPAVEARRAADNGGALVKEKFSIAPYGSIALVTDTEGNMIGLHSTG